MAHDDNELASPKNTGALADFAANVSKVAARRQKRLHQALLKHQAIIVTGSGGRKTLLIQSGEMSNPEEGKHRVTEYLEDGPEGHMTRTSITRLAQDLSRDLSPVKIEPASEQRVMEWMGTETFHSGSQKVFEMQKRNQQRGSTSFGVMGALATVAALGGCYWLFGQKRGRR